MWSVTILKTFTLYEMRLKFLFHLEIPAEIKGLRPWSLICVAAHTQANEHNVHSYQQVVSVSIQYKVVKDRCESSVGLLVSLLHWFTELSSQPEPFCCCWFLMFSLHLRSWWHETQKSVSQTKKACLIFPFVFGILECFYMGVAVWMWCLDICRPVRIFFFPFGGDRWCNETQTTVTCWSGVMSCQGVCACWPSAAGVWCVQVQLFGLDTGGVGRELVSTPSTCLKRWTFRQCSWL